MIYINNDDETRIIAGAYNGEASIIILTNQNNSVLLNLRDDIPNIIYPAHWTVPGGMKEHFETAEEAARREVLEEIGFDIEALTLFAQTIDTNGRNELISIYKAKIDKPISELQLNEGQALGYFSFSELQNIKIIPFVKKVLEKFAETHRPDLKPEQDGPAM